MKIDSVKVFRVIRKPARAYQKGSSREAAWEIAQALNGSPVGEVLAAWAEMAKQRPTQKNPDEWMRFFCGPDKRHNGQAREVVAEIVTRVDSEATLPLSNPEPPGTVRGHSKPEARQDTVRIPSDEAQKVWAVAIQVFGREDVTGKLETHLRHLLNIQRNR